MITNSSIGYSGQLANQIFQHATLIAVGIKKGYTVKLPVNNETVRPEGCYDNHNKRWIPYKLDLYNCFDLKTEKCSDEEVKGLKNKYHEASFYFDPNVFNIEDSTTIEGYFQSYKYFDDVRDDILKEFKFKPHIEQEANNVIKPLDNGREIVSLHIRRGDSIYSSTGLVSMEYIGKALEQFADKDYNFLVVSDDIPWCKETFQQEDNVFFSEGHSHYVDLCILSKCHHSIMSNSTFSFFGTWCIPNKNKRVIMPSRWFRPGVDIDARDLYYKDWMVI